MTSRAHRECDACKAQGLPSIVYRKDKRASFERRLNPNQARYGCSVGHEWIEAKAPCRSASR